MLSQGQDSPQVGLVGEATVPGLGHLEFGPRSGVRACLGWPCVVVGGAGFLPPPVLTGPPDFGLIFTAGMTFCFLAGSLGEGTRGAQEVLESQGLHDGQSREQQGGGQRALLGAGRFFRSSMLRHQAKSLPLSEPQIYSAGFPQGSDWVV